MVQNTADEKATQPKSDEAFRLQIDVKKIWQHLAPRLINLVNISALLTIAGFFVVQSYLASFSKLFTFNISVTQYLGAGINLVLAILWNIILPVLVGGLLVGFFVLALYFLARFCLRRSKRVHSLWTRLLGRLHPLYQRLRSVLRAIWAIYQVVAGVLLILLVIGVAFVYGTFYYAQSPRMFGGGLRADVILVFREDQPTQNSSWGFPINSFNHRQSERLQLLIELTDGILVSDPSTQTVVLVKNDAIQGIIDADHITNNAPTSSTTASPPPSLTP